MATLALSIGATASGIATGIATATGMSLQTVSPIVSGVGTLVGSVIDSQVLMPLLTPTERIGQMDGEGPQQQTSEGAALNLAMGPKAKLRPTLMWVGPLVVEKENEGQGLLGGGGTRTYSYRRSAAFHLANVPKGEAASAVSRIWGEGKLLYDDTPDASITRSDISAFGNILETGGQTNDLAPDFGHRQKVVDLVIPNSVDTSYDLTKAQSGQPATVSGFTGDGAYINGTKTVLGSQKHDNGTTTLRLAVGPKTRRKNSHNMVEPADVDSGDTVTLTRVVNKFSTIDMRSYRFYDGSQTTADSFIEAAEGVGNVPAYTGSCYIVLEDFRIEDFARRVPNLEVELEMDASPFTAGEAIDRIMDRAGFAASEYDTSGISASKLVKGYVAAGVVETSAAITPLLSFHEVVDQEDGTTINFLDKPSAATITVPVDDLAAGALGTRQKSPFAMTLADEFVLPKTVTVTYLDEDNDLERGAEVEMSQSGRGSQDLSKDVPMTITGDEARAFATRLLWEAYHTQRTVDAMLPPSYCKIRENDFIQITGYGQDFTVQVNEALCGANAVVRVRGVVRNARTYKEVATASTGLIRTPRDPGLVAFDFLAISPLRDSEFGRSGFYYASWMEDPQAEWNGAALFISYDDSAYHQVAFNQDETTVGETLTPLGEGPIGVWDYGSTVQVRLYNPEETLSGATPAEVLSGRNRIMVGGEIIGFTTATLDDESTWTLGGGLLRGLRGTEEHVRPHAAKELCIDMNEDGLKFLDINQSELGKVLYFKAVAAGEVEADIDGIQLDIPQVLQPAPPSAITAYADAAQVSLQWWRSSAKKFGLFQTPRPVVPDELQGDNPSQDQAGKKYMVQTHDMSLPAGATLVRTTLLDESSTQYTTTFATADGFSAGETARFKVYAYGSNNLYSNPAVIDAVVSL